MLVDQYGNEIKPTKRPETRTVAAAQLRDRWSSYPTVSLTPSRLATIFADADQGYLETQAELFEEMEEKDAHLASLLQTRKTVVMGLEWRVEPFSDDEANQEVAVFVEEKLRSIGNLEPGMMDLLDAIGKGYSLVEIDWQVGQYAEPVYLRWVHPKRVTFWNSLEPGITKNYGLDGEPLEPWKFIFHRHKARSGHDFRAGVLRVVSWMYLLKNYAMKDWATFNEVFGMPMRLGKYDPAASDSDKSALVTAIQALGSDAAGIISKSTEIEFIEASNRQSGQSNPYQLLADFCNREMSKAILGQTLTSDTTGATGTFAAGKVHDGVRRDIVEGDAEALAASLRAQLIRPLVGFNFGWDRPLPYFDFILEEDEDLKPVAETYKMLAEMGQPITLEHVSERFGVPLPEEGQELLTGDRGRETGGQTGDRGRETGAKEKPEEGADLQGGNEAPDDNAEGEEDDDGTEETAKTLLRPGTVSLRDGDGLEITPYDAPVIRAQVELEKLSRAAMAAAADVVAGMLAPIRARIAAGQSLEELRDGLLDAYPEMAAEELGELVYQASMLAYMQGRTRGN